MPFHDRRTPPLCAVTGLSFSFMHGGGVGGPVDSDPVAKNVESALVSNTTEAQLLQNVRRCLAGQRSEHLLPVLRILLGLFAGSVADDNGGQGDGEALESRLHRQWRALMVTEHLFLHAKPFRIYLLAHIHQFLKATLLGHELIRSRSLVTIGRIVERCRSTSEYKMVEFLPRYVRNQYKLHLEDDPRVLRRQQLSLELSRIADGFRSMSDYASDLLYELDQCFNILVPDPNRSVHGCLVPEANAHPGIVDDFEDGSGTDSCVSFSDESLSDEHLEWASNHNYNNERYGAYSMELRLNRSMSEQECDDNRPLFDVIRGCYRVLLKTICPELQNWKAVLQNARAAAKTKNSKVIFWNRSMQIRYGFVTSLCLRVEEAIWRCEVLLGLQDCRKVVNQPKNMKAENNAGNTESTVRNVSAPIIQAPNVKPVSKKKTGVLTARDRIKRKLKRK